MNKKMLSLLGAAFLSYTAMAQEQITDTTATVQQLDEVVLDTKFKLNREKSGKVITKITRADLENVQGQSLAQSISAVSGIEITGSRSNQGQNLSYRVRGGNNGQVVILIDGLQVNDPSSSSSDFDLRLLDVNLIESIEIIKGGVSTLYGTGAATAVISITTKKSDKELIATGINLNVGSNRTTANEAYGINTTNLGANVSGKVNKFNYLVAGAVEGSKGISAASSSTPATTFNDDPFHRSSLTGKLGYEFSKAFSLNAYTNINKVDADFDAGFGADAANSFSSRNVQIGINPEYKYNKGSVVLNASMADTERIFKMSSESIYKGNSIIADLYNRTKITSFLWGVVGANFSQTEMEQFTPFGDISKDDASITTIDPYVNLTYLSDFGLTVNAGARFNNHSDYGNHLVYNFNPSFLFDVNDDLNVKVLASGSTAFIAPSLSQLYNPSYGNRNLKPEESLNGEAGFELNYTKDYRFSAVAFHREDTNKIIWAGSGYANADTGMIKTQGVELEASAKLIKGFSLNANYTFLQPNTDVDGIRLPKHKANATASYLFNKEKTSVTASYQFNDVRLDQYYVWPTGNTPVSLDAYSLLNVFIGHQVTENLKLTASLFNALDEEYTEIYGYSTRGRNYMFGLAVKF